MKRNRLKCFVVSCYNMQPRSSCKEPRFVIFAKDRDSAEIQLHRYNDDQVRKYGYKRFLDCTLYEISILSDQKSDCKMVDGAMTAVNKSFSRIRPGAKRKNAKSDLVGIARHSSET